MENQDSFLAECFGYTGTLCSIFFIISPVILLIEARKTGSTEKIPGLMLVVNNISNFTWLLYGSGKHSGPLIISNLMGLILNIPILCWYITLRFEQKYKRYISLVLVLKSLIVVVFCSYFLFNNQQYNKSVLVDSLGYMACSVNIIMFVGPAQNTVRYT